MSACLQKSQPFWNARQSPFINNKGSQAKEGENLSSSHPTIKGQAYFVKPLTPDSFAVLLPTFLLESLKPFCLGEKVDFSRVGKMPNIHGNLEFFHFLYMFNWDLHKIINERIHYEHFLWRGEKRVLPGSKILESISCFSGEHLGDFSANSRAPETACLCLQNSKR